MTRLGEGASSREVEEDRAGPSAWNRGVMNEKRSNEAPPPGAHLG